MAYRSASGIVVRDVIGKRFGKLTVLGPAFPPDTRTWRFRVRCDCGKELVMDYLVAKRDIALGRVVGCPDCETKVEKPTLPADFFHP